MIVFMWQLLLTQLMMMKMMMNILKQINSLVSPHLSQMWSLKSHQRFSYNIHGWKCTDLRFRHEHITRWAWRAVNASCVRRHHSASVDVAAGGCKMPPNRSHCGSRSVGDFTAGGQSFPGLSCSSGWRQPPPLASFIFLSLQFYSVIRRTHFARYQV